MNQQLARALGEAKSLGTAKVLGARRFGCTISIDTRLISSVKEPRLPIGRVLADDTIENEQNTVGGRIQDFTGEASQLRGRVRFPRVPQRVVILAGNVID